MSVAAADRLLVLQGLRLKGFAEAPAIAALWQLEDDDVDLELKTLAAEGLVQRRDGRVSGWSLTPDGRAAVDGLVAAELDSTGARAAIEDAYQRFCAINPDLLAVCTAWQLRGEGATQVINDHSDPGYDAEVIARLGALHHDAEPVLADLAASLDRFARYPVRLAHALGRIHDGATEWFTKPLLDSYHTVWFELHEDLLTTLGRQRGAERST